MGNCIRKESSMQWGGDDWSEDYSDHLPGDPSKINLYRQDYTYKKIQEEDTDTDTDTGASTTSDIYTQHMKGTTQVKLKITRKQLEELLTEEPTTNIRGGGGGGASVEQVLAHFIHVSMHDDDSDSDSHSHQHHSWRPHLSTITEL